MKTIYCLANGTSYTFRTNDSGNYLFIDSDGSNRQLDTKSGYYHLPRMKRAISAYLHQMDPYRHEGEECGRIRYTHIMGW